MGLTVHSQYHDNSMAVDSDEMRALCTAAMDNHVYVLMGFSEKAGGSRYMAQALIGPEGQLLYTRRKLKPTHVERTVFGEGDGSDFRVEDTPLGKIGSLNCWEHIQPLSRMAMYSMYEEIHVAGWPSFCCYRDIAYALGPEVNIDGASMMYAVEGGCFVLASVSVIGQDTFDMLCDTPDKVHLLSTRTGKPGGGYSMIFGPDGSKLAEPIPEDLEGILYAELEPDMIAISKATADPVGHYARPDVLSLVFNRSKRNVVQILENEHEDVSSATRAPLAEIDSSTVPKIADSDETSGSE